VAPNEGFKRGCPTLQDLGDQLGIGDRHRHR
jgi:hypothetical protein